ncbi:MAG TPA: hypothetical protein VHE53_02560 [Patescibacteria group bacterium]|nr:hypothetical protein [Patescibacteria group bacterium]
MLIKERRRIFILISALILLVFVVLFGLSMSLSKDNIMLEPIDVVYLIDNNRSRELSILLHVVGPQAVVNKLEKQYLNHPNFDCHAKAYSLGYVSYRFLGKNGLKNFITTCNSGFMHGLIASYVISQKINTVEFYSSLCDEYKTRFEVLECYHGLGNGFMTITDNRFPKAIGLCQQFKDYSDKMTCYYGVFMESYSLLYGNSLNLNRRDAVRKNPKIICGSLGENKNAQKACYAVFYPPAMFYYHKKQDPVKLISDCVGVDIIYRDSCSQGIGIYTAILKKFDPAGVISVCMMISDKNEALSCLHGAQASIVDFWGENLSNHGNVFCNSVPEEYKKDCLNSLNNRIKLFSKM